MRVPTDLIGLVGAREVVRSLRTSDGRVARAQACLLRSELHGAFDQVRMKRRLGWSAEDLWLLIRPTLQSGDEIHAEKPRTLSWLMQQFLADKEGAIDRRTLVNVRYCLDLVLLVMGEIRLTELDRERCRIMRDTLIQLPKRVLQLYPGKSCAFILRQNLPPMNPKTANKAIHFFSSMLTWAERETLMRAVRDGWCCVPQKLQAHLDSFPSPPGLAQGGRRKHRGSLANQRVWKPSSGLPTRNTLRVQVQVRGECLPRKAEQRLRRIVPQSAMVVKNELARS